MYCTPWEIPRASIEPVEIVSGEHPQPYEINERIHVNLSKLKNNVSIYKIRRGEDTWQEAVRSVDRPVQTHSPTFCTASRAYNKLIEIIHTCALKAPARSFHMCEAPGGFAQAVVTEFEATRAIAMSLDAANVPAFSNLVKQHTRIQLMDHLPCSGNICHKETREHISRQIGRVDLVTADGAFDNDSRPHLTEQISATLVLSQVDLAIRTQALGGAFVLKIFGMTHLITLEIVALLTTLYNAVFILKPSTSKSVNDERYIVCTGFISLVDLKVPLLQQFLHKLCTIVDTTWIDNVKQVTNILDTAQFDALHKALRFKPSSNNGSVKRKSFKQ